MMSTATTTPELVGHTMMPSPAARTAPWYRRTESVGSVLFGLPSFWLQSSAGFRVWPGTCMRFFGSRHRRRMHPACSMSTYSRPLIGVGALRNTASRHRRNASVVLSASSSFSVGGRGGAPS